jgi:hypothetical protein
MDLTPESTETPGHAVGGAEISALPDGWLSVRLATSKSALLARAWLTRSCPGVALLVGAPRFAPTLHGLGAHLAALGAGVLLAQPRDGLEATTALGALAGFARRLAPRARLVICAAGAAAQPAVRATARLDAEALLLLSPSSVDAPGNLRGRPLLVCGVENPAPRGLSGAWRVRYLAFPGADETLQEVRADLAASCLGFLTRGLGLGAVGGLDERGA